MDIHVYNNQICRQTCESNKSIQIWQEVILRHICVQITFETRKRNTERERQTDRQTDRERETERNRDRETVRSIVLIQLKVSWCWVCQRQACVQRFRVTIFDLSPGPQKTSHTGDAATQPLFQVMVVGSISKWGVYKFQSLRSSGQGSHGGGSLAKQTTLRRYSQSPRRGHVFKTGLNWKLTPLPLASAGHLRWWPWGVHGRGTLTSD